MKNVTITLPDDVARAARVEAAKAGKSLSRYVSDLVGSDIRRSGSQSEALQQFLAGPSWTAIEPWPGRENLYAERMDALLRRHQHSGVREDEQ